MLAFAHPVRVFPSTHNLRSFGKRSLGVAPACTAASNGKLQSGDTQGYASQYGVSHQPDHTPAQMVEPPPRNHISLQIQEMLPEMIASDKLQHVQGLDLYIPKQPLSERRHEESVKSLAGRMQTFIDAFRHSSPYINKHQGSTFVIHIPGAAVEEPRFSSIMEDIARMRIVGIKPVLVLGPDEQVARRLRQENIDTEVIDGIRVTDQETLKIAKELAGSIRFEVESALAKGVINSPKASRISVVSGSFYSTQPVGVIDGRDFEYTGKVRRVDVDSIQRRLNQGDIVVIPNIGSSPSGQIYNCKSEEVAAACAAALQAEKLIFMGDRQTLGDGQTLGDEKTQKKISNATLKSTAAFLGSSKSYKLPSHFKMMLQCSVYALGEGVPRAHILDRHLDGVLLMEVFHRDGAGLMISRELYEEFRPATMRDIQGLQTIMKPLEDAGILKKRSRTTLEQTIDNFVVIDIEGMVIAGASLVRMEDDPTWAELECLVVHDDYRNLGKGQAMVNFIEREAFDNGVRNLFILSTQSFDWFRERAFSEASIDDLPESRRITYDQSRKSKIFHKVLTENKRVDREVLKRTSLSRKFPSRL